MWREKFFISIYCIALFFSFFIALCLNPIIYPLSLQFCKIFFNVQGDCILSSTESNYYGVAFALSFFIYPRLHSSLYKNALSNTQSILSLFYRLLFCLLSAIGASFFIITLLDYVIPIELLSIKISHYTYNQWRLFPEEGDGNQVEGVISCFFAFLCPILFTFKFYKIIKNKIIFLKGKT